MRLVHIWLWSWPGHFQNNYHYAHHHPTPYYHTMTPNITTATKAYHNNNQGIFLSQASEINKLMARIPFCSFHTRPKCVPSFNEKGRYAYKEWFLTTFLSKPLNLITQQQFQTTQKRKNGCTFKLNFWLRLGEFHST